MSSPERHGTPQNVSFMKSSSMSISTERRYTAVRPDRHETALPSRLWLAFSSKYLWSRNMSVSRESRPVLP